MLVLSRELHQYIVIDGNIKVIIASIESGRVQLAIEAPRNVTVHRGEIQDRIDKGEGSLP